MDFEWANIFRMDSFAKNFATDMILLHLFQQLNQHSNMMKQVRMPLKAPPLMILILIIIAIFFYNFLKFFS